jgi:predicted nucleotidyltransferase
MKSRKASIADLIESYFKSRPEVVAVYLFGSYAQGREKTFSDIDLGVLLNHKFLSSKNNLATTYTVALGKLLRKDFHIIFMNAAGEMLLFQIFKRGKCIFQRKSHSLSLFKTVSYSRIADFGFYRKSMERAFLSRILGVSK